MAPPDCGGGCALWWALVVAARAVGHWATSAALLCAVPGPLGPVYDGCGGAGGALPLVGVVVVARRCGRWWWQHTWLGIGRSAPRSCVQRLGLWAWWTVVVGGAGGVLRLLSRSRAIEVVGGWSHVSIGNGAIGVVLLHATPGSFDPVDRGGEWVRLVAPDHRRRRGILWLLPLVGRSPVALRLRCRALLHNARAFRPSGQWCGGVPLVPSDCRRRRRRAQLWPSVGRGLVAPRCQRRTLLCDVGSSLVARS